MTLQEIVYDIQNTVFSGIQSDDNPISNKQIVYLINYYRTVLIKQKMDKSYHIDGSYVQDLKEIKVIETEDSDLLIKGCNLYKTEEKIPNWIVDNTRPLLTNVGSGTRCTFQFCTRQALKYYKNSKLTGNSPRYFVAGNDIYFYTKEDIETINISGVFEEPDKVKLFNNEVTEFDYYNFIYPVPAQIVPIIKDLIFTKDLKVLMSIPKDLTNDTVGEFGTKEA